MVKNIKNVEEIELKKKKSEVVSKNQKNVKKTNLKEETPISLTNFEEDQEKTAIISIDELMKRAKELELIDEDERTGVNYLEKYNLEPSEIKEAVDNTINKQQEVKAISDLQILTVDLHLPYEV